MLIFISHTTGRYPTAESGIAAALEGGCRDVQLRMKGATTAERTAAASRLLPLCREKGARLIIDDDVEAVVASGADGVHLGKKDMPVVEARKFLGNKIIGATANTAADIIAAWKAGADYVGLGPFRWTTTKEGLAPLLGLEGYRRIMAEVRRAGVSLPIVAIGGITPADIPEIMATGVDGIALSGAILNAADPVLATKEILELI